MYNKIMIIFCIKCGFQIKDRYKFCPKYRTIKIEI